MKNTCLRALVLVVTLVVTVAARTDRKVSGQAQTASEGPVARPAQGDNSSQAKAGDVDTLEHILAAVYDSISGPAGPRDWARFRSLFYADARLIPTRDQQGKTSAQMLTVDEYVRAAQGYFDKEGFYESAVANRVEQWDHIAQVWSTYESRHARAEKPFARGINSFQFFNDGSRWWVVTIYWEGEGPGHALPEKYLK